MAVRLRSQKFAKTVRSLSASVPITGLCDARRSRSTEAGLVMPVCSYSAAEIGGVVEADLAVAYIIRASLNHAAMGDLIEEAAT
uniref:Uncharacterized protein n=1 Tax=Arundo donax TaxID=35708 RepID=A0A0A9F923_ARUDO